MIQGMLTWIVSLSSVLQGEVLELFDQQSTYPNLIHLATELVTWRWNDCLIFWTFVRNNISPGSNFILMSNTPFQYLHQDLLLLQLLFIYFINTDYQLLTPTWKWYEISSLIGCWFIIRSIPIPSLMPHVHYTPTMVLRWTKTEWWFKAVFSVFVDFSDPLKLCFCSIASSLSLILLRTVLSLFILPKSNPLIISFTFPLFDARNTLTLLHYVIYWLFCSNTTQWRNQLSIIRILLNFN